MVPTSVPQLVALPNLEEIARAQAKLRDLFPEVLFDASSRKNRRDFLSRVDQQVADAEKNLAEQKQAWAVLKLEYAALQGWDAFAADLERQSRFTSRVLGKRRLIMIVFILFFLGNVHLRDRALRLHVCNELHALRLHVCNELHALRLHVFNELHVLRHQQQMMTMLMLMMMTVTFLQKRILVS